MLQCVTEVRTFGFNVRRLRESVTPLIRQEDLATAIGHSNNSQVSKWENTDVVPSPKTVRRVASALSTLLQRHVEPSELLDGVLTEYDRIRGASDPLGQHVEVHRPSEVQRYATQSDSDSAQHYARLHGELVRLHDRISEVLDGLPEPRVDLPVTDHRTGTDRRAKS
jgi:transcriptional regulator with XRE-family HTH domain